MRLVKIAGTDCKAGDDCPAVFTSDRGTLVVQGYLVDRRAPDGEALVEVTPELVREAARALGW